MAMVIRSIYIKVPAATDGLTWPQQARVDYEVGPDDPTYGGKTSTLSISIMDTDQASAIATAAIVAIKTAEGIS